MYTPFDMLRTQIRNQVKESYYLNSMIYILHDLERVVYGKLNINKKQTEKDLKKRKEVIDELLQLENVFEYLNRPDWEHKSFQKTNAFFLNELKKIRKKGYPYINKVWNLKPNRRKY